MLEFEIGIIGEKETSIKLKVQTSFTDGKQDTQKKRCIPCTDGFGACSQDSKAGIEKFQRSRKTSPFQNSFQVLEKVNVLAVMNDFCQSKDKIPDAWKLYIPILLQALKGIKEWNADEDVLGCFDTLKPGELLRDRDTKLAQMLQTLSTKSTLASLINHMHATSI